MDSIVLGKLHRCCRNNILSCTFCHLQIINSDTKSKWEGLLAEDIHTYIHTYTDTHSRSFWLKSIFMTYHVPKSKTNQQYVMDQTKK